MVALHGFDASQVEPAAPFVPIPAGRYLSMITESEMKATKAATGSYLQLKFQIVDGAFKNRVLWARLNLNNPSGAAVQIARAELSAICRAVAVLAPKDSAELHDLPLVIHVRLTKRDDTGELANDISGYSLKETLDANGPAASGSTPPWATK